MRLPISLYVAALASFLAPGLGWPHQPYAYCDVYDYRLPTSLEVSDPTNEFLHLARSRDLAGVRAALAENPAMILVRFQGFGKGDEHAEDAGFTALHFAARNGDLPMVDLLLANGASVAAPISDHQRATPVHLAASAAVAKSLIAAGGDVKAETEHGDTPLHYAANAGVAEVLITAGADVNARAGNWRRVAEPIEELAKRQGESPLHRAAWRGRIDVVKLLVDRGADAHALAEGRISTVFGAVRGGHTEVVEYLLGLGVRPMPAGVKPTELDAFNSPLSTAVRKNHSRIVVLLIQAGCKPRDPGPGHWTLLHVAAYVGGGAEVIQSLASAGVPLEARTQDEEADFDLFRYGKPGDAAPKPTGRRTALHVAIERGNLEGVRALVTLGADLDAKTADSETPLSLAAKPEKIPIRLVRQASAESNRAFDLAEANAFDERKANREKIAAVLAAARKERAK